MALGMQLTGGVILGHGGAYHGGSKRSARVLASGKR